MVANSFLIKLVLRPLSTYGRQIKPLLLLSCSLGLLLIPNTALTAPKKLEKTQLIHLQESKLRQPEIISLGSLSLDKGTGYIDYNQINFIEPQLINPAITIAQNISDQAEQLFNEGTQLYQQGTAQSLQQALIKYEQALHLYQQIGDKQSEASILNNIGLVYGDMGQPQTALEYYQQALSIRQEIGDRAGEANALYNIALIYADLEKHNSGIALEIYHRVLDIRRELGDRAGEANTLYNMGNVNLNIGRPQTALEYYQEALFLIKNSPHNRSEKADILNNIGIVYYQTGQPQKALEYHQQALIIKRELGDRAEEADGLINIGNVYNSIGQPQKALEYYQQALPIKREVGDPTGEAKVLMNIGVVYWIIGQPQKTLEYSQQALRILEKVGNRQEKAGVLMNIGVVYNDIGQPQKALEYYQQALLISREIADLRGEAFILNNIGNVYNLIGQFPMALEYYQQAFPISREISDRSLEASILGNIGVVYSNMEQSQTALEYYQRTLSIKRNVSDRAGEATTLGNIANVYFDIGQPQKALEYLQQALPISREVSDHSLEATILGNIGSVYSNIGQSQKALEYHQQALPISREVGDRRSEALILSNLAESEQDQGNLPAALNHIQESIKITEELRSNITGNEARTAYFATIAYRYELYIHILMELHQKDPSKGYNIQAFDVSERSRGRSLIELLTEANTDIRAGVPFQLLEKEKNLENKLDALEKRRLELYSQGEPNQEQKNYLEQQFKTTLSQYEDIKAQIRAKSPAYAALKYPQPLNLSQVQQQVLDSDTVLIQYALGEEQSYVWVVTQEGMTSYTLPAKEAIEKVAEDFRIEVINSGSESEYKAAELSQVILSSFADKLTKKRILVVADGILQYIPFAALSLPPEKSPLISKYEIVNAPSSSTIAIIRNESKNRQPAPKTIAIIADPVFNNQDERVTGKSPPVNTEDLQQLALNRAIRTLNLTDWVRLPGTRQEAETILKLIPDSEEIYAYDFNANLSAATNPQLKQYKIVHFATHGILNSDEPAYSGLVFSLINEQGKPINGFMRLNDIFNLQLGADLVVLSACETGLGKEVKGEGIVGITRGFMYAGSPRLVVSLWAVDDQATREFMTRFYRLMLEQKLTPAQALKMAQLQMIAETEWKSSYYWAGFVLQGEWN